MKLEQEEVAKGLLLSVACPAFLLDDFGIGQGSVQSKHHTTQGFHKPPVSGSGGVFNSMLPILATARTTTRSPPKSQLDPTGLSIAVVELTIASLLTPTRAGELHWTLGLLN